MPPPIDDNRAHFVPWRSVSAGWIATALALLAGVPLFLCMPPWPDMTLYDMAARAILRGGIHYRDIFDTNLPGMPLAMAAIRRLFGWSYVTLRAVDLVVIGLIVANLIGWVRRAGGTAYSAAWLAAAIALFYLFTSEFNHVQRDPWLLLPAIIAARLRLWRITKPMLSSASKTTVDQTTPSSPPVICFWWSVLEGMVWGLGVWLKPHVIIPAFATWLVSAILMARRESNRGIVRDLAGLLLGGLIAGGVGVAWLIGTGAWPYFLDVFLNWNPSYLKDMWGKAGFRFIRTFYVFRPWSILHYAAIALGILAFWEARAWSRRPGEPRRVWGGCWLYTPAGSESVAVARALLAALYFGWLVQATCLQKGFDYVQVPLLFLAMTLIATHRWSFGFAYIIWFAIMAAILNFPFLSPVAQTIEPWLPQIRAEQDPLTDFKLMKLWPRCWQETGSAELRDKLGHYTHVFCATNWENLEEVAEFLKTLNPPLGPGELNCWHDSTHPLYLILNLEPATRYMHYGTVFGIRSHAAGIAAEVAASRQKYVVSDLMRVAGSSTEAYEPGADGDPHQLPAWFPSSDREKFPWNQPIVFRAGRYVVHKIEKPLGVIDIPDLFQTDSDEPDEQ